MEPSTRPSSTPKDTCGTDAAEQSIYEAAGGLEGLTRLSQAWHARVMADPMTRHPFEHGYRADHSERLAMYWAQALGGPPLWTELGEDDSSVLRMHACNGPHVELDEAAIACFDQAITDAGLDRDPAVAQALRGYWRWAIGLMNAHPGSADDIPDGLPVPQWNWDGPAE